MKKVILLLSSLLLIVLSLGNVNAFDKENSKVYKEKLSFVDNYINTGKNSWTGKNPKVSGYKEFFTEDEKKASYIEYKISCDKNPDCGFVIVNINGNDVSVPLSSPVGKTPSEALTQKGQGENTKMYYFGGFEQFSENLKTGEVQAINPRYEEKLLKSLEIRGEAKAMSRQVSFKKIKSDFLKQKLNVYKKEAKKATKNIKQKNMYSMRSYTAPSTPADTFLQEAMTTTDGCHGSIPCYKQFDTGDAYWPWQTCLSGCTPTAWAMIYGYYDRNGKSNLFPWFKAPRVNSTKVENIVKEIRGPMGTNCQGRTNSSNINKGIQYAKNHGYPNSSSTTKSGNSTAIANKVKSEIDNDRPIMLHNNEHSMVAYGYSSSNKYIVRMNMGWGETTKINGYYTSSIDYDIRSTIYLGTAEEYKISTVTYISIK